MYSKLFTQTRAHCLQPTRFLKADDFLTQIAEFVSPIKWHLAHTTWFWEMFVLIPFWKDYRPFDDNFLWYFNSYYNSLKQELVPKKYRGAFASRPTLEEIYLYRNYVEEKILEWLFSVGENLTDEQKNVFELGIHHEHQHQELIFMDIKFNFFHHPLKPKLIPEVDSSLFINVPSLQTSEINTQLPEWFIISEGLYEIGYEGSQFCFDNEIPRHKVYQTESHLSNRLVTCGEFLEFINAGGYENSVYWLSDGWAKKNQEGWLAPLYWEQIDRQWFVYDLLNRTPIKENEPVMHLSYYEADAYARWKGCRLPTEQEWEIIAQRFSDQLSLYHHFFYANHKWKPYPCQDGIFDLFGQLWQWTMSPYVPYPGQQKRFSGIDEYNSKFMANQLVLRGGCFLNDISHFRPTYRNFYYPHDRWLFSGCRLAK